MKKALILSTIIFFSLNLFSQTLLTAQGDTFHVTEVRIAPLKSVKLGGDTVEISITLSSADFKVVNGALALVNPPVVIDRTDWNQTLTATSSAQRVFTFKNVPADTKSFSIIKNGLTLEENVHYIVVGNKVTMATAVQNGTRIILSRKY